MLDIIISVVVGFAVGGLTHLLLRLIGIRARKTLTLIAAGLGMLGFQVWSEYSWFGRMQSRLPDTIDIVQSFPYQAAWQPWTYITPRIDRFTAIDRSATRRNDALPGMALVSTLLIARNQPPLELTLLVDCPGQRRAYLEAGQEFSPSGLPKTIEWTPLGVDEPLYDRVCTVDMQRSTSE